MCITYPKTTVCAAAVLYMGIQKLYNRYDLAERKRRLQEWEEKRKNATTTESVGSASSPIMYVFAHGFGAPSGYSHSQGFTHAFQATRDGTSLLCPNFSDSRDGRSSPLRTYLGQTGDARIVAQDIAEKTTAAQPLPSIVLVGASRGAAALINYLAFGAGAYDPSFVKCAVFDVPLASVRAIASSFARKAYIGYIPGVATLAHKVVGLLLPFYSSCKPESVELIPFIPKHIPLLFVGHWLDPLTPPHEHVIPLYKAAHKAGHNAYLLILPHGTHNACLDAASYKLCYTECTCSSLDYYETTPSCHYLYRAVLTAFYEASGVPHNKEFLYPEVISNNILTVLCKPSPDLSIDALKDHFSFKNLQRLRATKFRTCLHVS